MPTENESQLGPVARRLAATERVLSIEDEPDIATFLRAYFRAAGYDLVHVDPDSTEAIIAAVEEHTPDCILLDMRLRGFTGNEAYRQLRADEQWAFTPIIVVSAHAAHDPQFKLVRSRGLDAFVPKPFNTNTLADLVRDRIDHSRTLRAKGHDRDLPLLSQDYLEARLADELTVASEAEGSVAFVLVTLRALDAITAQVGDDGLNWVITKLLTKGRKSLPEGVVFGATNSDEVALIMPGHDMPQAERIVRPVLELLQGDFAFPGGANVTIDLVAGMACYPDSASDVDGLFMAADSALADAAAADELLRFAP